MFTFAVSYVFCTIDRNWFDWLVFRPTRKNVISPFPIFRIVLHLCHSVISIVLAPCPAAVYLSFDGNKTSSRKNKVKDESGNNNFATMENGAKVVWSCGKCDGTVFLNGTVFKCYEKCINWKCIFFACEFNFTNLIQYKNNSTSTGVNSIYSKSRKYLLHMCYCK